MFPVRSSTARRALEAAVAGVVAGATLLVPTVAHADAPPAPVLQVDQPYPQNHTDVVDGQPATWDFDVTNTGNLAAADISFSFDWTHDISETPTAQLADVTIGGPHAGACTVNAAATIVRCTLGTLEPGAKTNVVITGNGFRTTGTTAAGISGWNVLASTTDADGTPVVAGSNSAWFVEQRLIPPLSATVDRIAGADRYDTSVKLAQQAYPDAAGTVFLATGAAFPDALSAGAAAAAEHAPLLLTGGTALPTEVRDEIAALHPSRVVVVGGPAAVSDGVLREVAAAVPSASVDRVAGADRYATSLAVAADAFSTTHPETAWVATGEDFPDALSAAAAAGAAKAPVILVPGSATSVPAATLTAMQRLGVTSVDIAGGFAAVSNGIQVSIESTFGVDGWSRWAGADRYQTSADIAVRGFLPEGALTAEWPLPRAYLASGETFPDALAGSAVAAAQGAPLVITSSSCVQQAALSAFTSFPVSEVTVIGGTSALSGAIDSLTPCSS